MTISIWRYSHIALAVISAIFIIIASITGAILAFEPISEKLNPYRIDGIEKVTLAETVEALKENYKEVIQLKTDYNEFVFINAINKDGDFLTGYINPISGKYLGPEIEKYPIYSFATNLHRSLFLKSSGRILVGIASFLLFLIAITGTLLIIKRQGGAKKLFSKIVYENFLQYFHVVLGRFSFIPIVIITLTGVYLSLFRFDFFPEENSILHQKIVGNRDKNELLETKDFLVFKNTMLLTVHSLDFPFSDAKEDSYTLRLKNKELLIDQYSGEILSTHDLGFTSSVKSLNVNLHTGKGSIIWSIILFISCINILFFICSGFFMTIKRRRNKLRNKFKSSKSKYVVLVGSENGNTIAYANAFYKQLINKGEQVYITELNEYRFFEKCEHLIIITSTYGQGEAPVNGNNFLELLNTISQNSNVKYSLVGFGSKEYPDFCKFAIDITRSLKNTNITPFIKPFYINNRSFSAFSKWFNLWAVKADIIIDISEISMLKGEC